jgi:hypothetical protein
MRNKLIHRSAAAFGLAALAVASAVGVAAAATQSAGAATRQLAAGGQAGRAGHVPFATRAESVRLARRLLAKVVLPPGTRRFHGRRLPADLRSPAEEPLSDHLVDVHRVFTEGRSMGGTIAFLDHHHPAGWSNAGTGEAYNIDHGKKIITEEDVEYAPAHIGAAFSEIEMVVEVVPGHHGHALSRADVQVIWYPRRSVAEHLIARHFRAVRIDAWIYGKGLRHVKRTFRQRAIIDKLTRVLNALPASPGGVVSCPAIATIYELTFKPVNGGAGATVTADGCFSYGISVGGHQQPALVDNGKIERIADHLMRGSHKPRR